MQVPVSFTPIPLSPLLLTCPYVLVQTMTASILIRLHLNAAPSPPRSHSCVRTTRLFPLYISRARALRHADLSQCLSHLLLRDLSRHRRSHTAERCLLRVPRCVHRWALRVQSRDRSA